MKEIERFKSLVRYNLNEDEAMLTYNNDIRIYTDGKEKFRDLIREMEQAKQYIHIQYYIIRDDELWMKITNTLRKKVRQGVKVRILFDSMGCRNMKRHMWKKLKASGIEVAEFFPAFLGTFQLHPNCRNHRKIVVIDTKVGFIGGFNIGREYIGRNTRFGPWRDTHLRIEGSAVAPLAVRFALDWNQATKENLFFDDKLFALPGDTFPGREPVQIITSGPDSRYPKIRDHYLRMIHMAEKNIYIQTPYFIPDKDIRDALIIAARSGVDVRIMIPCKPDHMLVYWATCSYIGEMIEAGAKCYIYSKGFLHSKCVCVDGMVSCVGTANMDIRSFLLNFEVNAIIYSEKTTRKLEEAFEKDILRSRKITRSAYRKRSVLVRAKERFCRLFSPLL